MALIKGTNSYATVLEADTYFSDRLDVTAWTSASEDRKSQALITATSMLDDLTWNGAATNSSQSLAFPRSGYYFDPRLGITVEMINIPLRISNACLQLANHLLNNDGLLDDTGSVIDLNVGGISLSRIRNPSKVPSTVKRLIRPLLSNTTANAWWRAN
jgi:hypothetical protein